MNGKYSYYKQNNDGFSVYFAVLYEKILKFVDKL